MNPKKFAFKDVQMQELGDGHFRLVLSDDTQNPVTDIEFNNRKAARNWGKSRGYRVIDQAPDGSTMHGPN